MNLTIYREQIGPQGAFSTIHEPDGGRLCVACEHSYQDGDIWLPKIPAGTYVCKRGIHQLAGGEPFETFEVTGVTGHEGLLFHSGNTENDSHGCILVGTMVGQLYGLPAVLNSRTAFDLFMSKQVGVDEFQLTVRDD